MESRRYIQLIVDQRKQVAEASKGRRSQLPQPLRRSLYHKRLAQLVADDVQKRLRKSP